MTELRPFQVDLIDRVAVQCRAGKRIIVVQGATGCGKNTIAAAIVARAVQKDRHVLFMVHRRKLVDQISERLLSFQVQHGVLMRGEKRESGYRVTVASRDTLMSRCVNNGWIGLPPADLVLVDEAHHAANPQSEYRRILEAYPGRIILLLSATPVGPDGKGMGPWAQAIECALPTSQLVQQGYLVPVKCFAPDRKKKGRKFLRGIMGDLVGSWQQYAEGRPTVLFCARVSHSLEAVEAYKAAGVAAAHIDADTPDEDRELILEQVASGKIKVLSNVGIIGEGVDVPELSCCQLFCEVGSRVKFLQACGRIMRIAAGKRYGILIDHSGAVFRHGFPDEDTTWTLEGNVDAEFAKQHEQGLTEKAFYCKQCELVYHGQPNCPQCGRVPKKPPRSIFLAPPVETTNELLTEVGRQEETGIYSRDEKIRHWLRCLGVAANRNGTFAMASVMYKQKYKEWPDRNFPCTPGYGQNKAKVAEVYPNFIRRKKPV